MQRLTSLVTLLLLVLAGVVLRAGPAGADGRSPNLLAGGVYGMSNDRAGNAVVAFARAADGTLTSVGSFPTGGTGSGSFEDSDNGLVLGSARGEVSPNNLIQNGRLLFATNAGSNSLSVFRVHPAGLELVEVTDSGGEKPVSVTVNRGIVYVLNSGELIDDLFDENGEVIPNCTTGELPSVTGFTVSRDGQLKPISGSTRQLSGDPFSGCAQVSFNPSGDLLVVTERTARIPGQAPDDEGVINTFAVNDDGTLGEQRMLDATGQGPFGFTFTGDGALLTTEQFDGLMGPGRGAAAGYTVNADGTLTATSSSVNNGGTDTCWIVATDNGRYAYASSFFGTGRISSYRIGQGGALELLDAEAADDTVQLGASDLALSRFSRYLYQLNSPDGTISAYRIGRGGSLKLVQVVNAHAPSEMFAAIGLAAS